jgi:hypothetical protein
MSGFIYIIFLISIIKNYAYDIQYNFMLENLQPTYNQNSDFGKTFTLSPLNDLCHNNFEKENAKGCLTNNLDDWNCIYNYCISSSRPQLYYITITLPPIYYNNETTKQCHLI